MNYSVVGFFVVTLTIAMVAIVLWLSEDARGKRYTRYTVYMNEAVSGLSEDTPVKFNGVQVGYVESIKLNPKNYKQVILTLKIDDSVPITETTVATLLSQGITGLTYVGLKAKTAEAPLLKTTPQEKYPVIKSEPSLLVRLDAMLGNVAQNVKALSASIEQVFDEKNRQALAHALQHIEQLTGALAKKRHKIDESIDSLDETLKNLAEASGKLSVTMASVRQAALGVKEAGQAVTQTMNHTNGAVQTFTQQTLPTATDVMQSMKAITVNLEQLSDELKRNPSIILRGRQPMSRGPGE